MMAMVTLASTTAEIFAFGTASGNWLNTVNTFLGESSPMNGNSSTTIKMTPMPVMKPEITGYGMYWMKLPMRNTPSKIWIKPAARKIARINPRPASRLQVWSITCAMINALTTVMGPVGVLIKVCVPPNSADIKPSAMAQYSPAVAPRPDCTPNANAKGRVTTPAVIPPNKSPRKLLNLPCIDSFSLC